MSLSLILNDDPLPLHNAAHHYNPQDSNSSEAASTYSQHSRFHSTDHDRRVTSQSTMTHQHSGRRHSGLEGQSLTSPGRTQGGYRLNDDDTDVSRRKRRKGGDEDADYQPPGRRHSPRKAAARGKHTQPRPSPPPGADSSQLEPTEFDESRLASTDLDDCEELWLGELSEYIVETQKRQKQVEKWFEATTLERNFDLLERLTTRYQTQLDSIVPPSPPRLLGEPLRGGSREVSPEFDGGDHSMGPPSPWEADPGFQDTAEGVAHELERSLLGEATDPLPRKLKGKGKDAIKRTVSGAASDISSDFDVPTSKRRKVDKVPQSNMEDKGGNRSSVGGPSYASSKAKGKAKQLHEDQAPDSISATPKAARKRAAPRRKGDGDMPSHPPSVAGDQTPTISRAVSPAPTVSTMLYELDEVVPPLKKAKKVDDTAMAKRIKALEEAQRKVWTNIAKKDIAKAYKFHTLGAQARQSQCERIAKVCSLQARKPYVKNSRAVKETQAKAKKLMREMQVFWKRNEKEERDVRKREHKEAMDRAKIEEEKREAARQARKLEFLISQTELYSHFVGSKLKTNQVEGENEETSAPAGANIPDADPNNLRELNFDDEDHTNLHQHARRNAQEAIALARQRAEQFDTQAALERKTNEALKLAKAQEHIREDTSGESEQPKGVVSDAPLMDLDSDELNFQNPTSLSGPLTIAQPTMLMAQLKEYQLKGLNWLATLYDQGINGILADEMGLGKTVQSISLLAYLAETHDIWGPFLVVAPASTLHNWQQEITRFVPRLKALPYWGNVKDRTTLRKFWSKKEISYNQDAPFHVLITSYQLVTQDQQYFQRVKWQYMVLDEAQNIKNSSSVRWKTLLGFQCRNRLLLTGTPIQNSMQELWALLHFIMPSLFDSHDEFNEWFSKDIENAAAENKGSKLNEHQLRRLHMILKPFMLRRVKRHVQNELSEKIEKDIFVDLSPRQRALYKALLANVSVADLLEKAANINDADSARSLMNLVMQFRKVCNHPELFERADVVAPFSFSNYGRSGPRETDFVSLNYSSRNPIEYTIPEIFYQDGGLLSIPCENSKLDITRRFSIWSTEWIHKSLTDDEFSSWSFLRLANVSPQEAHSLHISPLIRRRLLSVQQDLVYDADEPYVSDSDLVAHHIRSPLHFRVSRPLSCFVSPPSVPPLNAIMTTTWTHSCLSRPGLKWFVPPVVAPPISMSCSDRSCLEYQQHISGAPLETMALYGLTPNLRDSELSCNTYRRILGGLSPTGLIQQSSSYQLPPSPMQVPEAKRLIYDSAKLARLDSLLQELKAGDHRVLIYFQMTRMMDLMEEYLIFRQYKYLRLDGSSKLEDRRDMVMDWQTRPDIFIFLLSTRAGGLGINLTAADTVVFYDHDWNPSNDAQAMDRAHRLGQTRQVTVYRLITKGTIDERIVQLARVKKDVQDIVVGNKNFTDATKPSEIVQLLLNDEQFASLGASGRENIVPRQSGLASPPRKDAAPVRDLWNEEGDDFFGHAGVGAGTSQALDGAEDESGTPTPAGARGKKRKQISRPRKSTGKRKEPGVNGQST